jgi:ABC-type sugar transport system substrate-binding protein
MKNNKVFLLIAAVAVIALVVYFLSKSGKTTGPDGNNPSKEVTKEQIINSLPKASKKYKIGVLFPMLAAPFWVNESYGVLDQAKQLGVEVVWYSADGYTNVDKQNSQIEDLITQKVDAILIAPTSLTGNTPAIEKAISKGIKVFIHVTGTSAKGISGSVLADDKEIGKAQAEYTVKALNGKGKVIMLTGPSGADWAMNRQKAYKEYMTQNAKDIIIVAERSGEPERVASQKIIEELLIKFNDVDAVYTAADGMAIGVAQTLSNTKTQKKIIVTTASFSKESVPYIQNGQITVNVDESPMLQGRTAMNALIYVLEGYKVPQTIIVPVPGIDKAALEKVDLTKRWAPEGYSPSK